MQETKETAHKVRSFELCTDTFQGLRTVSCEDGPTVRSGKTRDYWAITFSRSSMKRGTTSAAHCLS